jgi:hypothetical protein
MFINEPVDSSAASEESGQNVKSPSSPSFGKVRAPKVMDQEESGETVKNDSAHSRPSAPNLTKKESEHQHRHANNDDGHSGSSAPKPTKKESEHQHRHVNNDDGHSGSSAPKLTGCAKLEEQFNSRLNDVKSKYLKGFDWDSKKNPLESINTQEAECFKLKNGEIVAFGENVFNPHCTKIAELYAAYLYLSTPGDLDTFGIVGDKKLSTYGEENDGFAILLKSQSSQINEMCTTKLQDIQKYHYAGADGKIASQQNATKIIDATDNQECFKLQDGEITAFGEDVFYSSCREIVYLYTSSIYSSESIKLDDFYINADQNLTDYQAENADFLNYLGGLQV